MFSMLHYYLILIYFTLRPVTKALVTSSLIRHSHGKFVTLRVNSINIRQFHPCSTKGKSIILSRNRYCRLQPLMTALTLLYSMLLYSTLPHSTVCYPTLHSPTLPYATLLYTPPLYSMLLYSTLPHSTVWV